MRDVAFDLDATSNKLRIVEPLKKLIISSGDTSDVDGFLALAEYSKVFLPISSLLAKLCELCGRKFVIANCDV